MHRYIRWSEGVECALERMACVVLPVVISLDLDVLI